MDDDPSRPVAPPLSGPTGARISPFSNEAERRARL